MSNNKFIHLTNDAVQKNCSDYGKYESWNKLSFLDFQIYLQNMYPEDYAEGKACFYTGIENLFDII